MKIKNLSLCLLLLLFTAAVAAQDVENSVEQRYDKAFAEYGNGQFDLCERHTLHLLPETDGMLKKSAYRLLALCRIEKGDLDGARKYVADLLRYDPYFTPSLGDPRRFVDLIEEKKQEATSITTASRQKETIDEAPVPVTLITEEMIRHSGARTLLELLCLFVPGMTMAEGTESNVAMHGVYSLSQEKILFLLDGHRMNSYSTNAEAPDYRTSLDKIQHIEVLRGPASSLYGNIALTAVVNIITRKGASINGGRISGTVGSQHSYGGSMLLGGGNNVVDIMAWGGIFSSKGFKHELDNPGFGTTVLYSHGYRDKPSYDVGLKGHWRDFTLTLMSQRSKKVPYINVLQTSPTQKIVEMTDEETQITQQYLSTEELFDNKLNYNYDRYSAVDGDKPGVSRLNHNINVDYSHTFGNVDIQASAFISMERTSFYNVLGDSVETGMARLYLDFLGKKDAFKPWTQGSYIKLNWENSTVGAQLNAMTNYNLLGKGSLLFGVQYEHFSLSSGTLRIGGGYNASQVYSSDSVFNDGAENSYSVYAQLKHYFTNRLILNAGLRYDHKVRFAGSPLDHLSPRLSVIYKFSPAISTRLSYNYSFVDAPYLYRSCLIYFFSGGNELRPEIMNAFQFGATYHKPNSRFTAEMSGFYNIMKDIVMLDFIMSEGNAFVNAAKMHQLGVDGSVQYVSPRFFFNANATWQRVCKDEYTIVDMEGRVTSSQNYMLHEGNTLGTPELITNITAAYSPYKGTGTGFLSGGTLWLRGTLSAQTKTYYKDIDMMATYCMLEDVSQLYEVKPQCTIGLGLSYEWKHLDLDVSVRNITNNQYCIGSMLTAGVPRPGREIMAKATVKF